MRRIFREQPAGVKGVGGEAPQIGDHLTSAARVRRIKAAIIYSPQTLIVLP
jgi:hypothetical protein